MKIIQKAFINSIYLITLLAFSLLGTGCSRKGGMMMIGLNEKGEMVKKYLPAQHTTELGKGLNGLTAETLSMLAKREKNKKKSWELTTYILALSLSGRLGNSVIGVESSSFIEFTFEKN